MAYYLADFIKIGAFFIPNSTPKLLSRDSILLYGELCYRNERLKVAVKTTRGSVPVIVRTIGLRSEATDGREEAFEYKRKLKEIRRNALRQNINGLRDAVRVRSIVSVGFVMCLLLLIAGMGLAIFGLFLHQDISFFFLLLGCFFLIIFLYKRRWLVIPFGHLRGAVYGVDVQNK